MYIAQNQGQEQYGYYMRIAIWLALADRKILHPLVKLSSNELSNKALTRELQRAS